jgi:hypothetical protein
MVIGDDPVGQLEPRQRKNPDTCPEAFLGFCDVEDEYRERYLSGVVDASSVKANDPDRGRLLLEVFPTFEDYMDEVFGPRDEWTGRYGWRISGHAHYDWYQFGGRFSGHLILKPGRLALLGCSEVFKPPHGAGRADQARRGDIDFAAMSAEDYAHYLGAWSNLETQGKTGDRGEKSFYDIPDTITTREKLVDYARKRSAHVAPAAIVIDGQWSGPWWLIEHLTEESAAKWDARYSALLESLSDDTLLTVVDCHA